MHISIRTRRISIRSRLRDQIERYLRKVLQSEQGHVVMATLYITSTPIAGSYTGFACRLVIRSPRTGKIVVNSNAPRLTVALKQAARRARILLRQRSKRRRARGHGSRLAYASHFDLGVE